MNNLRLSAKIGIGVVFAMVALHYAFHQPFIPGAVFSAIPEEATSTYLADNLAELLQSPVCGQIDRALGAGNSLAALLGSNDWTRLAAASEIAVADIPLRHPGQSKTWVAASWVGWRSPWLRWKLTHAHNANLRLLGKHSVWPVWAYEAPDIARGMSLTFALTDNLFLACLSESPSDILLLLETYDRSFIRTTSSEWETLK